MIEWLAVAFVLLVAIFIFAQRRRLAAMEGLVVGGSVGPGCVTAQAIILLALGLAIAVLIATGFFGG
ncbi:MAG TPA: hypothetical protein VF701_02530 [Thermoanaerobaculia bacterium]